MAAIGSPFGERQSLSIGVISALDRTIESLTQFAIGDAIQTDAAINPGNSGGPLLDARARDRHQRADQVAAPAEARASASRSRWTRCAARCASCVTRDVWTTATWAWRRYDLAAASRAHRRERGHRSTRADVVDGSPAEDSDLQAGNEDITFQGQDNIAVGGDLIVAVDGKELTREHDLADEISGRSAGEKIAADRAAGRQAAQGRSRAGPPPGRLEPLARNACNPRCWVPTCFRVTSRKSWRSPR